MNISPQIIELGRKIADGSLTLEQGIRLDLVQSLPKEEKREAWRLFEYAHQSGINITAAVGIAENIATEVMEAYMERRKST